MRRWVIAIVTFAISFALTMHALTGLHRANAELTQNDPHDGARIITSSENDPKVAPKPKRPVDDRWVAI